MDCGGSKAREVETREGRERQEKGEKRREKRKKGKDEEWREGKRRERKIGKRRGVDKRKDNPVYWSAIPVSTVLFLVLGAK